MADALISPVEVGRCVALLHCRHAEGEVQRRVRSDTPEIPLDKALEFMEFHQGRGSRRDATSLPGGRLEADVIEKGAFLSLPA